MYTPQESMEAGRKHRPSNSYTALESIATCARPRSSDMWTALQKAQTWQPAESFQVDNLWEAQAW